MSTYEMELCDTMNYSDHMTLLQLALISKVVPMLGPSWQT